MYGKFDTACSGFCRKRCFKHEHKRLCDICRNMRFDFFGQNVRIRQTVGKGNKVLQIAYGTHTVRYALKLCRQNIKAFHAVAQTEKAGRMHIFGRVQTKLRHIALFHHAVLKNAPSGTFAPRIHRHHREFTFYPCFPTFLIKFRYSSRFFPYFFLKILRKKLSFSYPTLPMISLTERSVSAKNLDAT